MRDRFNSCQNPHDRDIPPPRLGPKLCDWYNRTSITPWNNPGGSWFDRNNAAQGNVPFASITFNANSLPDNKYYAFNVTELVQNYVAGTYNNTGFFLKAKDENDNYIAFYSSDWSNVSQRPKLVINYTTGSVPTNPAPSLILFFPTNITLSQSLNNQSAFSITTDQVMSTDNWYIDGGLSASGSKNFAHTWTQAGLHNVTYSGSNANGSVGITWIVNVTAGSSPSDVNLDGVVNNADLVIVAQNFGEDTTTTHQRYDVNTDGIVNILDLTIVANKII